MRCKLLRCAHYALQILLVRITTNGTKIMLFYTQLTCHVHACAVLSLKLSTAGASAPTIERLGQAKKYLPKSEIALKVADHMQYCMMHRWYSCCTDNAFRIDKTCCYIRSEKYLLKTVANWLPRACLNDKLRTGCSSTNIQRVPEHAELGESVGMFLSLLYSAQACSILMLSQSSHPSCPRCSCQCL